MYIRCPMLIVNAQDTLKILSKNIKSSKYIHNLLLILSLQKHLNMIKLAVDMVFTWKFELATFQRSCC